MPDTATVDTDVAELVQQYAPTLAKIMRRTVAEDDRTLEGFIALIEEVSAALRGMDSADWLDDAAADLRVLAELDDDAKKTRARLVKRANGNLYEACHEIESTGCLDDEDE